jgi:hypothetical protein
MGNIRPGVGGQNVGSELILSGVGDFGWLSKMMNPQVE